MHSTLALLALLAVSTSGELCALPFILNPLTDCCREFSPTGTDASCNATRTGAHAVQIYGVQVFCEYCPRTGTKSQLEEAQTEVYRKLFPLIQQIGVNFPVVPAVLGR